MQRALGDEHAAAPEGGGSLGDRHRAEAGYVTDEPKAVEEAIVLYRPLWPAQTVGSGKVLGERTEVSIVAGVARRLGPLRDGFDASAIIAAKSELVEKLAHGMAKVLTGTDAPSHTGERFGQTLGRRRVLSEPVGSGLKWRCHRKKDRRRCGGRGARVEMSAIAREWPTSKVLRLSEARALKGAGARRSARALVRILPS